MFRKTIKLESGTSVGTGWLPPLPDLRDYTEDQPEIASISFKLGMPPNTEDNSKLPKSVDLEAQWFSKIPIENQGELGSCTANAAAGIIEYFELRAHGKYLDCSRLFIYKTTRNLMGEVGDTGAWLRNTMGALALCGVAPENHWPNTDSMPEFDEEPPSFVYAIADNFEALKYFCHDPLGYNMPKEKVLQSVKKYLASGIPAMFGFWGFPSSKYSNVVGGIPYPCPNEEAEWGHAIVAVGYDDNKKIKNTICGEETKGALKIRNSWGEDWGDNGYGWLPYKYVLSGLALDFWSIISMEWVGTGQFGL